VATPAGTAETFCWDERATGHGLITAPAALDLVP